MSEKRFNCDESSTAMMIKWIDKMDFLNGEEKALLLKISFLLIRDRERIIKIYDEIDKEEEHYLTLNDEKLELSLVNKKMIVSTLIDFSEDILPLGTVVSLNDELIKPKENQEIKIIITHRFLANERSKIYFTYSGTVYPAAHTLESKLIHFNKKCIKKVYFEGYSDEIDKAYVLSVKNDLIFRKEYNSIDFASQEQIEIFNKEAREG